MGYVIPSCHGECFAGTGVSYGFVAFREQFTGDTSTTTFQLSGAIENGVFTQGSWQASRIKPLLNSHAVNQQGKPIYKTVILGIGFDRIYVQSISPTGLVTLNFPPRNEDFDIWYWYQVGNNDVVEDYVKEDFVASMEADWTDLEAKIDTKITRVPTAGNNNVVIWDTGGQVKDSGVPISDVSDAISKKHTAGSETQGGDISGTVGNATVNKIKNRDVEITTTKGDILVDNGTQLKRLPVGADGEVLKANSTEPLGVKWETGGVDYGTIWAIQTLNCNC